MLTLIYKKFDIGILYKNNMMVNHRSLIKVFINPFLRLFGYQLATIYNFDIISPSLGGIVIIKCKQAIHFDFFSHNECDYIERKRMII